MQQKSKKLYPLTVFQNTADHKANTRHTANTTLHSFNAYQSCSIITESVQKWTEQKQNGEQ